MIGAWKHSQSFLVRSILSGHMGPPVGRNSSVVTQMIPFRLIPDFQKRDHMRFRRQANVFSQGWENLDYSLQSGFSAVKNHLDAFPGQAAVQRLLQESGRYIWIFILNPQSFKSRKKAGMQKPTHIICAFFFLTFIHIPTSKALKNRDAISRVKRYIRPLNSLWKQGKVHHIWDHHF